MKKELTFNVFGKEKASKYITDADIKKGAKLTPKELNFINNTTRKVIGTGYRNVVLIALMSSIAGCVIRGSEGGLSRKTVVKMFDMFIQL